MPREPPTAPCPRTVLRGSCSALRPVPAVAGNSRPAQAPMGRDSGAKGERPMSEPRTETQDGPTTRKPQDTPFSEWTVLTADDVDGVTWYFHVPTAAVEREAATYAGLAQQDECPEQRR